MMKIDTILAATLPEADRVAYYNRAVKALALIVADVIDAPCLAPQLILASALRANDYNPNHVARPEMALLEQSIRCDGVTMPVVTYPDGDDWVVIDGFHRRSVILKIGSRYVPCSEIDRTRGDRIASTVRHNRARGKHQVDLMGDLVKELIAEGWDDERIAEHVGLTVDELLRLKQIVGVAKLFATAEYGRAWEQPGGPNLPHK